LSPRFSIFNLQVAKTARQDQLAATASHDLFTLQTLEAMIFTMPSPDTTFQVQRAQFESYRKMGPENRLAIGFELSDSMRNLAFDSYRSAHPELSRQELQLHLFQRVQGWQLPQRLARDLAKSGS
jgi:hypothetical protein